MDQHRTSAGPVISVMLLLLAAFYLGSYFALVVPEGVGHGAYFSSYRLPYVDPLFWPLEQVDRKFRTFYQPFYLQEDGDLGPYIIQQSILPIPIDAAEEGACHD